ncbi:MAG: DUF3427 domain-containing protein [Clostridiaceae bacterium]|nr:DUF3427 domain-containing protein [Clostridiaceae bacterium]
MTTEFLTNYTEQTFLDRIKHNLRMCDSFVFSVSFIKKAGLVLLLKEIDAALARGCSGRIITSTYQNFTDIESLRAFYALDNKYSAFECHLDFECFHDEKYSTLGYHSKGYIFTFRNHCEIVIGSSNITRYALLKNIEWDLLLSESLESAIYMQTMKEYNHLWTETYALDAEIIKKYEKRLNYAIERWDMDYDLANAKIKPNFMQRNALKELNRYRTMGIFRAIMICSSGSGKTFLSAFDALNFNPKRLLYIVHESSILKKSMETFQIVFGPDIYCGLYTGESKELDADFLFSTNILMARDRELFAKDSFDYIIIDECHHAAAESYKKIISYFEPEFLLGLTATPERMDNQDVLELFDKNVPYELRLRDAIINDLVVPFHYYGIRDTMVEYGLPKNQERKMIAQIVDEQHCEFVRAEIEKHRHPGKLKALVFCRNITHARQMSEALGEHYHTAYLTGANTVGERVRAYDDLQSETKELELLCSVDILNEGVDIPGVNMIIFLRPTESSTVFIQQLGRGLRKFENKPYVTVLDFIGNSYKRSVQIVFALGNLAQNLVLEKRLMMSLVKDDFSALQLQDYGVEIHIDDLSKEEIIESLENENFNSLSYMKQDYNNFKRYIGSEFYPRHLDFLNNDCAPDLQRFMSIKISGRKTGCYYSFLTGIDEEDLPSFSDEQTMFLKYASSHLNLVRPHEFEIISILQDEPATYEELSNRLSNAIDDCSKSEIDHALKYMLNKAAVKYENDVYSLNVVMDDQFQEHLQDLLTYGLTKYRAEYDSGIDFILWHSYRNDQVQLKLLKNPGDIFKGTYIYGKMVVIFASLKKDATVEERLNYKDKFLAPDLFQWESENNIRDNDLKLLRQSECAYVFVRKVSYENGIVMPFTFVGRGRLTNPRRQDKIDKSTGRPGRTYLFDIPLENELPDYLQYDFGLNS